MNPNEQISSPVGFSIGICATGNAEDAPLLVENLLAESPPDGLELRQLVVVASECSEDVVSRLEHIQANESRMHLVSEDARQGKADAVNKILIRAEGDLIVLVNSDAHPQPGALRSLLSVLASDPHVGAASAMPVTRPRPGLASAVVDLMWATHNECSYALNHMDLSNHACDELVAFRLEAVTKLPDGLVNDGAFMAATVRRRGYTVKFCAAAKVLIETPSRPSDLIGQRRRILFGHAQVWRRMGDPPKTMESLMIFSPLIGLRLLVRALSRRPRFLLALPAAILTEFVASSLSIWDSIRSTKRYTIWRRFT